MKPGNRLCTSMNIEVHHRCRRVRGDWLRCELSASRESGRGDNDVAGGLGCQYDHSQSHAMAVERHNESGYSMFHCFVILLNPRGQHLLAWFLELSYTQNTGTAVR